VSPTTTRRDQPPPLLKWPHCPVDQLGIAILQDLVATDECNEYNYLFAANNAYQGEGLRQSPRRGPAESSDGLAAGCAEQAEERTDSGRYIGMSPNGVEEVGEAGRWLGHP
jgi:hypothetical protein